MFLPTHITGTLIFAFNCVTGVNLLINSSMITKCDTKRWWKTDVVVKIYALLSAIKEIIYKHK